MNLETEKFKLVQNPDRELEDGRIVVSGAYYSKINGEENFVGDIGISYTKATAEGMLEEDRDWRKTEAESDPEYIALLEDILGRDHEATVREYQKEADKLNARRCSSAVDAVKRYALTYTESQNQELEEA